MVDYRDLLLKYIRYVTDREGIDFIEGGYQGYRGDQTFSDSEWEELSALADEAQDGR